MKQRIEHLDGFRGIAILLVLGFHAYSRWKEVLPYGDRFAEFPLFRTGWVGVDLFFLISGFVILMTLENCPSPVLFLKKRWLRLFPAMAICSLTSYGFAQCLPSTFPPPNFPFDLMPGLLFIDPNWLHEIGLPWNAIEGSYWSIFVEVKFYVIAAILYHGFGARTLVLAIAALHAASIGIGYAFYSHSDVQIICLLRTISLGLDLEHFGWFAAGASLYLFRSHRSRWWLAFCIAECLMSSLFRFSLALRPAMVCMALAGLFLASNTFEPVAKVFRLRPFLFMGYISYPFYLIHEGIVVRGTVFMGSWSPTWMPPILLPVLPAFLAASIAWCVARVEPTLRSVLAGWMNR